MLDHELFNRVIAVCLNSRGKCTNKHRLSVALCLLFASGEGAIPKLGKNNRPEHLESATMTPSSDDVGDGGGCLSLAIVAAAADSVALLMLLFAVF